MLYNVKCNSDTDQGRQVKYNAIQLPAKPTNITHYKSFVKDAAELGM